MTLAATAAREHGRSETRLRFALGAPTLLALVAVAAMLPVALGPIRLNDSHWINYSWSQQFTAQVLRGVIWPRWLPESHGGLGSPTFFFYGPVAFWLAALFGAAGAATWPALVLAATAALWASGLAMFAYLRERREGALFGAIAYMAAPYHLVDFAARGALAEFCAYAALPLVALGVRRCGAGGVGLLAGAYALLIMTHLPTALLASVFLLPALLLFEHGLDPERWLRCACGLALGVALAAPYLVPALVLQPYASIATMTGTAALDPARWTIWSADPRIAGGLWLVEALAGASMMVALGRPRDRWSAFVLATAAMALGIAPALWRLPLLAEVQFPWRLMVIVDFGTALLLARASAVPARALLLAAPALVLSLLVVANPPAATSAAVPTRAMLDRDHPEVIEYLPPGAGEAKGAWSRLALARAARPPHERTTGDWTAARRFAFPSWEARCAGTLVETRVERGTGLLAYRGRGCVIARRVTGPEVVGWSLAGLAASLLALGRRRTGRRP